MLKKWLKPILRQATYEARLHAERLREPKTGPCVLVFPSNQPWDPASRLRAWELAPELRGLGWRVIVVPEPLGLKQRRRVVALERPDVILMQQTRHPLNNPALFSPTPCVLDADDADYMDPRYQSEIARRAGDAAAVVGGSRFVADCLGKHNDDSTVIWTATPLPSKRQTTKSGERGPIVAWAHASPLGYRDEAELVGRILLRVAEQTPFTFWLFGTRSEEAKSYFSPLNERGVTTEALPPMPYEEYLAKVAEAAIGLQPVCTTSEFSRGKSFGKVLAYLAGEVAVVASNAVDHPLFFEDGRTAFLPNDEDAWVQNIVELLGNPARRTEMAARAYDDFERKLSMPAFAQQMDQVLRRVARL